VAWFEPWQAAWHSRAMVIARVCVGVIVLVGCTVESGDGASFGGEAMETSGSSGVATEAPASSGEASSSESSSEGGEEASTSSEGSSGSSTDPGSDATSDPGSESGASTGGSESGGAVGEHGYGPCNGGGAGMPCGGDAECIVVEGLDGSFCSPWCGEDLACPNPTSGEAFAQCQLGPDLSMDPVHCALLCEPGSDECPAGMNCVDTGMPVGVCLFQG
jgi:hypothetical protein